MSDSTREVEGFWPPEVQVGFSGLVYRCRKCTGGFRCSKGLPDDEAGAERLLKWLSGEHQRDCPGRAR